MHPYLIEIKKIYSANADVENAKGAKAYLLNQFEFFGIKTPLRRKICKAFYATHPIKDHAMLTALVKASFAEPHACELAVVCSLNATSQRLTLQAPPLL